MLFNTVRILYDSASQWRRSPQLRVFVTAKSVASNQLQVSTQTQYHHLRPFTTLSTLSITSQQSSGPILTTPLATCPTPHWPSLIGRERYSNLATTLTNLRTISYHVTIPDSHLQLVKKWACIGPGKWWRPTLIALTQSAYFCLIRYVTGPWA